MVGSVICGMCSHCFLNGYLRQTDKQTDEPTDRPIDGHTLVRVLRQCTASLHGGNGQWICCNALQHCPGVVGSGSPLMRCHAAWGLGSATPTMDYCGALGQWAVELVPCTTTLPRGSGELNLCNAQPHFAGAVGSKTLAMHSHTAWSQRALQWTTCNALRHCLGAWALETPPCSATVPGRSVQRTTCNALPHCLGALGTGTPTMHCLTTWG